MHTPKITHTEILQYVERYLNISAVTAKEKIIHSFWKSAETVTGIK